MTPTDDTPAPLSTARQASLSSYWFAYNLQWAALLAIVLPSQVALLVGDAQKEFATGAITAIGALFSLVLTPLAGALSDRSGSRHGRRRPFIVFGTMINVAFVLLLARCGAGTGLALFTLLYLGVQLGSNWAAGPYAALLPDLVAKAQRGAASGWMALMSTLGTLVGALAAGQLVRAGSYTSTALVIAAALVVTLLVTVFGVRETPRPGGASRASIGAMLRNFLPDPGTHRDFYWVMGTRCMIGMGIYAVFSFFQYFLGDILNVAHPEEQASYLIGVIIAAGIPTSLIAGAWSDRTGRKPLVYLSGGVMALASTLFIAAGMWPSPGWIFAVGALFGIGYGAYQAVDWALAIDVLPPGEDAAKDMGLWHVALVLPQVLAPALSGALLGLLKPWSLLGGYAAVFAVSAAWCLLGTVLVSKIRGAR